MNKPNYATKLEQLRCGSAGNCTLSAEQLLKAIEQADEETLDKLKKLLCSCKEIKDIFGEDPTEKPNKITDTDNID